MSFEEALAALRLSAIEVDVGGRTWRVPPLAAVGWFEAILSGDPLPIVPGVLSREDQDDFLDLMMNGTITQKAAERANREALGAASGWKWWEAERMIVSIAHDFRTVGGMIVAAGIDLTSAPLGQVLAAVYAMAMQNLDKEGRFRFQAQLTAPPVGYVDAAEWFEQGGFADSFRALVATAQTSG